MDIVIRHAEPNDYEALHRIFSGSRVIEGTLRRFVFRNPTSHTNVCVNQCERASPGGRASRRMGKKTKG